MQQRGDGRLTGGRGAATMQTTHYFSSHETLNPYAIIPRAPAIDYSSPHDRDRF
jgi:glutathionyl-hydroquinone reductase